MAGHNKWSKIKHKKAKTDAQKGKVFSKMGREITVAVRMGGGGDEATNFRLRLAVQLAKAANVPNDIIKRAIQRGLGADDGEQLQEKLFEAYAPHGVALMIETLSDNNNRTVANLKTILSKNGGSLATKGSVAYQFKRVGVIEVASTDYDAVLASALASDADDVEAIDGGGHGVRCQPDQLATVQAALDADGLECQSAQLVYEADTTVVLDVDQAGTIIKLLDQLDDDDDVQRVHGNYVIPDSVLEQLDV
ncbi:MAG: YebC/PmpR family DNA-binding transcriptional regulator [bacterium]|nr:YebC/PmpR family DNA-binding transcriptional regulator [bacterium]